MQSILGLMLRLAWLRRRTVVPVVLGVLVLGVLARACAPAGPAVATFNIRDFPDHAPHQVTAAFETIRELDVPIVAVQEIGDVAAFQAAAREHLGRSWESVFAEDSVRSNRLRLVGLAYDGARYRLDFHRTHDDVRVEPHQRPALEVRLVPRKRGPALRVFVVHLKAQGEPKDHLLRRKQLERLRLVVGDARRSDDEVIVLGDFNATGEADRKALREFADETMLVWASESLGCTAYWTPDDKCTGSALDHVFTTEPPRSIAAKGPCESVGCAPGDQCPIYYEQVSDHCPVRFEL